MTKVMGPWATHFRGIDISQNMVDIYNQTARESGLKEEQVNAVVGDLLAEEVPESLKGEEWFGFDIAIVGLGFHHFENPVRAVERLTERLKPATGVLLIIDFLPFDKDSASQPAAAQGTIKHGGFARTNMEKIFKVAKLENFSFSVMEETVELVGKDGTTTERTVFFARGRKEATAWGKVTKWFADMQGTAGEQFQITPREKVQEEFNLMGGRKSKTQPR